MKLPAKFKWRISHDASFDLLVCMPDPSTVYRIVWSSKNRDEDPAGILVYRKSLDKRSGYVGDVNFVVDVQSSDEDFAKEGFKLCCLYTDLEEAKNLAYLDYVDNIFIDVSIK